MSATDRILASRWWYLLPLVAILCYGLAVLRLADNAPKFDDLNDIFGFFEQLALAQTPWQQAGAFFYPNNEHVTLVNHLAYFVQYRLLGEIRIYPLILLGHLVIIATGLLLGAVVNSERKPFCLAVIAIAYINLLYWDSSFKAMTAISNQVVILLAVATLFALLRWRRFTVALPLAFLATFSQGNGMLVWPLGLMALWLDPHWRPARLRYSLLWLAGAGITIAIFSWAHQHYGEPSQVTAGAVLDRLQQQPLLPLQSLLAFLGSTLFVPSQAPLAIAAGTAALCALLWHARQPQRQVLLLAVVLFLLVSALTAGALRGLASTDAGGVLESRYRMYSVAFVLLALAALLEQLPRQRIALALAMLLLALGIHASGYRELPAIRQQAQKFAESYGYWLVDGDFRRQSVYFPPMSDHFLFVAGHLGIFNAMQLVPDVVILQILPAATRQTCPPTPAPADHCPMTMRHRGNAIAVAIDPVDIRPALPATITLCDEQAHAVMAFAIPETAAPPKRWLVPETQIPAGTYRVLFQSAQQAVCETQLTKKPRKVETEMRTLFGR